MLQLPLGKKDLILEVHDFDLLLLQLRLLGSHHLIVLALLSVDTVLLRFLLTLHYLVHLLGQLVDLRLELDILLDHLLPIGSVLIHLLLRSRLLSLFLSWLHEVVLVALFFLCFLFGGRLFRLKLVLYGQGWFVFIIGILLVEVFFVILVFVFEVRLHFMVILCSHLGVL